MAFGPLTGLDLENIGGYFEAQMASSRTMNNAKRYANGLFADDENFEKLIIMPEKGEEADRRAVELAMEKHDNYMKAEREKELEARVRFAHLY